MSKSIVFIILMIFFVGLCFAQYFPAGITTEYFGLEITPSADLDLVPGININHPVMMQLPHHEYLIEPVVIGLAGEGLVDIEIGLNLIYPFVCGYYGSEWHRAEPYTLLPMDDFVLSGVDFEAGSDVILLLSRNDPLLDFHLSSFTADYIEGETPRIELSWTTEFETGLSSFKIFHGLTNDLEQAVYIHQEAATNTEVQHSYTYDILYPMTGYTHYIWLRIVDHLNQGSFWGPVSVVVGTPYVPQNGVSGVFPNPNSGEFWCVYEVKDSTRVSILLLDCNNNVVKEIAHQLEVGEGGHLQRVRVPELPDGLYRLYYWFEQAEGNFYAYGDVLIDRNR